MSYMCSQCTMSVRRDACRRYRKCADGDECQECNHLGVCHLSEDLEEGERGALECLAKFFAGEPVGFSAAGAALGVVATALAVRTGPFTWGEHEIGVEGYEAATCASCGADFEWVLTQPGCSAVEAPPTRKKKRRRTPETRRRPRR